MADNKVNFLRGTSAEYEAKTKDNDTFYYTTDDEKLYLGNKEITGGGVTIDDSLSDTSKNPVQNKVINAALNSKANLSDIPTTLPANGGNAQALTDYNSTDVRLMLGWRGASLDSTIYLAGYDTSELESNGIVKIKDINADKAYVGNAGNADTVDGKHASDFALKTDIPTTLPANGGTADTARQTVSPNAKVRLWEDSEGGNLHLESPDGNHSVEMDLYNNSFRMVFIDNGALTFPVDYNSTTKKFNINGNAATVNGLTVQTAVPANAKFTDTTYDAATASTTGLVTTGAQTLAVNKTFNGQVIPAGASAVGTAQARKIYAGTSDMTAGPTALETGAIYLVYE